MLVTNAEVIDYKQNFRLVSAVYLRQPQLAFDNRPQLHSVIRDSEVHPRAHDALDRRCVSDRPPLDHMGVW